MVRRARRVVPTALHRVARLRAEPAHAVHRPVSRPARGDPDRRPRQAVRRLAVALAAPRARCRRSATGSGLPATTPTTTASGTSAMPTSPTRRPARSSRPTTTRATSTKHAVARYLAADPLGPYGFSGWVGPEPHGAPLANAGVRRDPLIAARVVAWLEDRYERRRAGDADALKPFLLVASFVNPHDIVLFPAWIRQGMPIEPGPLDPPRVAPSPTDDEDLASKPAAQIAYRESYPTGYGPVALVGKSYRDHAQEYRDLYYRLHAEVDGPLDQVRRAITAGHEAGCLRRGGDRAHRRSRRAARRSRRTASEVVQPVRRGHPGAVRGGASRSAARPNRG